MLNIDACNHAQDSILSVPALCRGFKHLEEEQEVGGELHVILQHDEVRVATLGECALQAPAVVLAQPCVVRLRVLKTPGSVSENRMSHVCFRR